MNEARKELENVGPAFSSCYWFSSRQSVRQNNRFKENLESFSYSAAINEKVSFLQSVPKNR